MGNGLFIEYNALKIEIENNLSRLKKLDIDIDITEFEKNFANIEVEKDIRKQNANSKDIDTLYQDGITKLKNLNSRILKDYERLFQMQVTYESLLDKINSFNPNFNPNQKSEIREYAQNQIDLLNEIKESSIDSKIKKSFIEKVYNLAYQIIKLELVYSDESALFESVSKNDTDVTYIVNQIKKEIEKVQQRKNLTDLLADLKEQVCEIEKKGLKSDYYLSKKLIMLLCIINDEDLIKTMKNNLSLQLREYEDISQKLELGQDKKKEKKDLKKEKKRYSFKIVKKRSATLASLGLISFLLFESLDPVKNLTSDKLYKTTTTIYDTSNPDLEPTIEYLKKQNYSISLKEYSPWDEPGYFREEYKRQVYTYDISSEVEVDNLVDYLNADLKESITVSTIDEETFEERPEDIYEGNKYVITKIEQDTEDYYSEEDIFGWISIISVEGIILLVINMFLLSLFGDNVENLKTNIAEIDKKIKEINDYLLANSEEDLRSTLTKLRKEIESIYESLPNSVCQESDFKEKMLTLENIVNKDKS